MESERNTSGGAAKRTRLGRIYYKDPAVAEANAQNEDLASRSVQSLEIEIDALFAMFSQQAWDHVAAELERCGAVYGVMAAQPDGEFLPLERVDIESRSPKDIAGVQREMYEDLIRSAPLFEGPGTVNAERAASVAAELLRRGNKRWNVMNGLPGPKFVLLHLVSGLKVGHERAMETIGCLDGAVLADDPNTTAGEMTSIIDDAVSAIRMQTRIPEELEVEFSSVLRSPTRDGDQYVDHDATIHPDRIVVSGSEANRTVRADWTGVRLLASIEDGDEGVDLTTAMQERGIEPFSRRCPASVKVSVTDDDFVQHLWHGAVKWMAVVWEQRLPLSRTTELMPGGPAKPAPARVAEPRRIRPDFGSAGFAGESDKSPRPVTEPPSSQGPVEITGLYLHGPGEFDLG